MAQAENNLANAQDTAGTSPAARPSPRGQSPLGLRILLASLLFLALAGGTMAYLAPLGHCGESWAAQAMLSRSFLVNFAMTLGSAALLVPLGWVMWQAGAMHRRQPQSQPSHQAAPGQHEPPARLSGDERGSAMVEFALVFPIVMLLVLLMAQSTLLMAGNLMVHYSAFCAARSAIVQVPRDVPNEPHNYVEEPDRSNKLGHAKLAAVWAVMPVSCADDRYPTGDSGVLRAGLNRFFIAHGQQTPVWVDRSLPHRLQYAQDKTQIWLDQPQAGAAQAYGEHEDIVANVDHTFYLSVPYMNRMFMLMSGSDGRDLEFAAGQYGVVIHAKCRLPNEGVRDWIDVEKFEE